MRSRLAEAMGYGWLSALLPDDATAMVLSAIDSDGHRIYLDKREKDWVVKPVTITRSKIDILIDKDAVVRTPDGDTDLDHIFKVAKGAKRVRVIRLP